MESNNIESPVANFYKGKALFITGATGFVGKVLVEKILRSCPEVKSIYCLMRPKKNQDPKTRFSNFVKDDVFGRLRKENPDNLQKINLISGDMMSENLGIGPEDRALLIREVNVVFHSAATIKFTEPINFALQLNTFGARKVVQLCRELQNIQAFVHVSTCYSNAANLNDIKEEIYSPPMDPDVLDQFLSKLPENVIFSDKSIIRQHPNTYTFTKSMAEHLVATETGNIPTIIVRPSVVGCSLNEPYPGWIDNYAGITGLTVGMIRGTYRTSICDNKCKVDLIPVDLVANSLILAAASLQNHKSGDAVAVLNCSSGPQNPLTWGKLGKYIIESGIKFPTKYIQFYPSCTFRLNRLVHLFMSFFLHFIPALTIDTMLRIRGEKPLAMRLYNGYKSSELAGRYFALREWNFDNKQLMNVVDGLEEEDKKRFNFDCKQINWEDYFQSYMKGINKFLLKDDSSPSKQTMKKLQRLYWVQVFCRGVVLVFTLSLLM